MSVTLPAFDSGEFSERLQKELRSSLATDVLERLWLHYEELRRWSPKLSLVGRGTAGEILRRHYAESLAALPLLDSGARLVDLGSGAGFPGWILAAARPDLDVWLVEARHKKAVFLEAASRKAALSCTVLNARVGALLPVGFPDSVDLLTIRALRLESPEWAALGRRMSGGGRILRWVGPSAAARPAGFGPGRRVEIADSGRAVEELLHENREYQNR